jgi:type II secretory pathway component PulC
MLNFFIQLLINIIISLILIYLCHLAWDYLKTNYSVKKTKDLVNIQNKKIEQILNSLNKEDIPVDNNLNDDDIKKLNDDLESYLNLEINSS